MLYDDIDQSRSPSPQLRSRSLSPTTNPNDFVLPDVLPDWEDMFVSRERDRQFFEASSDDDDYIDTSNMLLFTKQPDRTWYHRGKTFHTFEVRLPKLSQSTKLILDLVTDGPNRTYEPYVNTKKPSVFRRKPTYTVNGGKKLKMEQDPAMKYRYTMDIFSSYGNQVIQFETAPDVSNKKSTAGEFYYQLRINNDIITSNPFRAYHNVMAKPKRIDANVTDRAMNLLRKLEWYDDDKKCLLCGQEQPQYHLDTCDFMILYE